MGFMNLDQPELNFANVIRNVIEAAVSVQMPAEHLWLVLCALEEIGSKEHVCMDELKQLGEFLPGAMFAGAKAMNKPLPEFVRLVLLGKVIGEEFLLPFSRQIKEMLKDKVNSPERIVL
jgi:hypothetical protein